MSASPLPPSSAHEPVAALCGVGDGAPSVLVFDSSTETLALAANGPAGAFALTVAGGAAASASLLPQALRLLQHAGLTLQHLQAVGFGSGPGAFTGLRTACAVAQGLGLGLGLPLLPIDSLLVVAEDARLQQVAGLSGASRLEVAVVMDARMNEVYAGRYRWLDAGPDRGLGVLQTPGPLPSLHQGCWQTVQAPQLYKVADLLQAWRAMPLGVVAGSALLVFNDALQPLQAAHRVPLERGRAAALLQLALGAWAAGQGVDAAQALPLYVRDKVAQTTVERDQARLAAAAAGLAGAP